MFIRDGEAEFFHDGEHVFPGLAFFCQFGFRSLLGAAQQVGRMDGEHEGDACEFVP